MKDKCNTQYIFNYIIYASLFRLQVINLPLKRKQNKVFLDTDLAQNLWLTEVNSSTVLSTLTGKFTVKDNSHNVEEFSKDGEEKLQNHMKYEFGSVNVQEFVMLLNKEGIYNTKVDQNGKNTTVHLVMTYRHAQYS